MNKQFYYALETEKNDRTFHIVFAPDLDHAWDLGWEHAEGVKAIQYYGPYDSENKLTESLYETDNDI